MHSGCDVQDKDENGFEFCACGFAAGYVRASLLYIYLESTDVKARNHAADALKAFYGENWMQAVLAFRRYMGL